MTTVVIWKYKNNIQLNWINLLLFFNSLIFFLETDKLFSYCEGNKLTFKFHLWCTWVKATLVLQFTWVSVYPSLSFAFCSSLQTQAVSQERFSQRGTPRCQMKTHETVSYRCFFFFQIYLLTILDLPNKPGD